MIINNHYNYGQIVYLCTDTEQRPFIITAIQIRDQNISYECTSGTISVWCQPIELTEDRQL